MKKILKNLVYHCMIMGIILIYANSCTTEEILNLEKPILSTASLSNITQTGATSGGTVISEGSSPILARGVCWSFETNPLVTNSKTSDGSGAGIFISNIEGLVPNTTYYLRAYAINSIDTVYGNELSFTTSENITVNGLIAWYPFIGNTNDESGNGNNATLYGASLTVDRDGNAGKAYNFNGSTNYISIPHSSLFNVGTGDFTIYALIKTGVIPSGSWNAIVSKHNTANWHDTEFFLMIEGGTGNPYFGLSTDQGVFERIYGSVNICDNQYHELYGIRENGQIKLYVDGILVATAPSVINPDNNNPLNIGRSSYNDGYGYFNGVIDDVKIYNIALQVNDIQQSIVAFYPFNGNTNDESINGNDGTLYGAILSIDRHGDANKAYKFNGTDNYISASHNSVLNFGTGNFTIYSVIKTGVIPLGSWSAIVSKHNTANWHDTEFFLIIDGTTGNPYFGLSTNLGVFEIIYGTKNICDNQYHTLCGVKENGQIKLYVDGILVDSTSSSINPDNSNQLNIGRSSYNNGYGYFNGIIDGVTIYNRALTGSEILSLK